MYRPAFYRFIRSLAFTALAATLAAQENPGPGPGLDQASQQDQSSVPTLSVNVDLVNVLFAVRAKKGGALIPNLTKDDFTIYEDGKQQTIKQFSRETDLPLTLGLLIDISASQENLIGIEQNAASQFFSSVIRPKDEAFLISFGHTTDLLQDYTNSPRLLRSALNGLQGDSGGVVFSGPAGNPGAIPQTGPPKGTLLYDAIYLASNEKLKSEVGRKAIVLITDGDDQGSYYKIGDAIESAQRANAIIYSIYYVDHMFYLRAGMLGGGGGESELRKMSDETGGHVFVVNKKHTLDDVFKELQDEMRNQYSIGYRPTNDKRDGTFRHIEIKTTNGDYKVQARSGYYATPNDAQ